MLRLNELVTRKSTVKGLIMNHPRSTIFVPKSFFLMLNLYFFMFPIDVFIVMYKKGLLFCNLYLIVLVCLEGQ